MELLEQFVRGDLDAFESIFREHQNGVYGWIVRIVRDPAAAEDLTIETFWRIYRARARFDATRELGPWARRIATRLAYDHLKAARPETVLLGDIPQPGATDEGVSSAIRLAFAGLPPRLREVAELALIEEKSYAEVAQALAISVGAVKSRAFRAVRLLRKTLRRLGVES
ncbi:MAG: RNA polymerase sigma factor [Terriglobales bacterium]